MSIDETEFCNYGFGVLKMRFNEEYPDIPDEKIGYKNLKDYLWAFYIVPEYGIRGGEGKPMLCMRGSGITDMANQYTSSQKVPMVCSKYICESGDHGYVTADTCIQAHAQHVYIRDISYGLDEAKFKASIPGILIAYEKKDS